MILGDFDTNERMAKLEENLKHVTIIKNSFSDNRASYRAFANNIDIDFKALDLCCDTFERNLLIDIYTYSEQLIKRFYYEVLEKDRSTNKYVNYYLNKKLDPEKFSPNVKFSEVEKNIKNELISDFNFIFSKNKEEVRKYDELIKARHRYAHIGEFYFNAGYEDVIAVIKYIISELDMIVTYGTSYRLDFQKDIVKMKTDLNSIIKSIKYYESSKKTDKKVDLIEKVKLYRNHCKKIIVRYESYFYNNMLLSEFISGMSEISTCDLRNLSNTIKTFYKFKEIVDNTCFK